MNLGFTQRLGSEPLPSTPTQIPPSPFLALLPPGTSPTTGSQDRSILQIPGASQGWLSPPPRAPNHPLVPLFRSRTKLRMETRALPGHPTACSSVPAVSEDPLAAKSRRSSRGSCCRSPQQLRRQPARHKSPSRAHLFLLATRRERQQPISWEQHGTDGLRRR